MSVSVIVPSYQGDKRLPLLLEQFSRQKTEREWELIVVVDGSTDNSAEVLAQWQEKLPLRAIIRSHNLGRSATLNEGFEAAHYDILVRCDDDLVPAETYVEDFATAIETHPHSGVTGLYRNIFPENKYARIYGRRVDVRYENEALAMPREKSWALWAGNCAVTRALWEEIGPYDQNFREYGWEDVDWGYRLFTAGHDIVLDPLLVTKHRLAATTASIRLGRARLSGRARTKFVAKHNVPNTPRPHSLWNSLMAACSLFAGTRWGSILDVALNILPAPLSRKLIDLSVEAAFLRGEREANHLAKRPRDVAGTARQAS
ncbi:MAG: glycosyltransferase family 2 protein [Actinomycetales bacterium]|nr:glycosyltransferase family 2 protein [Actinomycetales bacterium]